MNLVVLKKKTTTTARGKKRKKSRYNFRNKSKYKNNNKCFLGSQLSASFPLLLVNVHLHLLRMPSNTGLVLGTCCGGSSDSDWSCSWSALHPMSTARATVFLCGNAHCPFIFHKDTESAELTVWISLAACTAGGTVLVLFP